MFSSFFFSSQKIFPLPHIFLLFLLCFCFPPKKNIFLLQIFNSQTSKVKKYHHIKKYLLPIYNHRKSIWHKNFRKYNKAGVDREWNWLYIYKFEHRSPWNYMIALGDQLLKNGRRCSDDEFWMSFKIRHPITHITIFCAYRRGVRSNVQLSCTVLTKIRRLVGCTKMVSR